MIYEYNLTKTPSVSLSTNAQILSVQFQYGDVTLWADTDPDAKQEEYIFVPVMTGSKPPKGWIYLTTLQSLEGNFVQHIYRNFVTQDLVKAFFG